MKTFLWLISTLGWGALFLWLVGLPSGCTRDAKTADARAYNYAVSVYEAVDYALEDVYKRAHKHCKNEPLGYQFCMMPYDSAVDALQAFAEALNRVYEGQATLCHAAALGELAAQRIPAAVDEDIRVGLELAAAALRKQGGCK